MKALMPCDILFEQLVPFLNRTEWNEFSIMSNDMYRLFQTRTNLQFDNDDDDADASDSNKNKNNGAAGTATSAAVSTNDTAADECSNTKKQKILPLDKKKQRKNRCTRIVAPWPSSSSKSDCKSIVLNAGRDLTHKTTIVSLAVSAAPLLPPPEVITDSKSNNDATTSSNSCGFYRGGLF